MSNKRKQQLELLDPSQFQRNSRSGMIVSLTESNASQEVTPRIAEEIRRSKALTTVHTGRLLKVLRTQLIAFHKSPIGQSIEISQPDRNACIDLDTLTVIRKKPETRGWSDMGWAYRWSIPAIRQQLNYQRYYKVNIEEELSNLLIDIPYVWLPTSKDGLGEPYRLDVFISVNTPSINKNLDAAYFNINSAWIESLINEPNAAFAYHERLTKDLSKNADILADYFLKHFSTDGHQTPIERKESWYKMVPKPTKMSWKEYAYEYIRKPLKEVKSACKLAKLEFKTNGRRGDNMLTWLEYSVKEDQPLPLYTLPQGGTERVSVTEGVSSTGQSKMTWAELSKLDEFINSVKVILEKHSVPKGQIEVCLELYGKRAASQKAKSIKSWLWPLERWVKSNTDNLLPPGGEPKLEQYKAEPKNKLIVNKARTETKVGLTRELITEKWVKKVATSLKATFGNDLLLSEDFAYWMIDRFINYHHIGPGLGDDALRTEKVWEKLYTGFVMNGAEKDSVVKSFSTFSFDLRMIAENPIYKEVLDRFSAKNQSFKKIVEFSLLNFREHHLGNTYSVRRWEVLAWEWLRNDEDIKNLKINLPKQSKHVYSKIPSLSEFP